MDALPQHPYQILRWLHLLICFPDFRARQFCREVFEMRFCRFLAFLSIILLVFPLVSSAKTQKSLDIYFVDVEGGQATLLVSPSGQSMLIDTGWPGNEGRDADRIAAAAKLAGISQIDYVLITHYHND